MATIMITGATDGIGLGLAKALAQQGHDLLLHGRSKEKLAAASAELSDSGGKVWSYQADFSDLDQARYMCEQILAEHHSIDVLVNNAGVYKMADATTTLGIDARYVVNTITPYLVTKLLSKVLVNGRVINVSSAAQAQVDMSLLTGKELPTDAMQAYAQSKLAITAWTFALANSDASIAYFAVNPGSLLATNMVKKGWGIEGKDPNSAISLLTDLALSEQCLAHRGEYFDNDQGNWGRSHPDTYQPQVQNAIVDALEGIIAPGR